MRESEKKLAPSERKQKIRERYRASNDNIRIIPAREKLDIFQDTSHKRVGVYARVSTDNEEQTSSFELQKQYYEELIKKHPNWELIDIYADEGISGTSLLHRDEFMRMIGDCNKEKLDLIITKNVSRFARNIEDCIHYSRELKGLSPPVGILFEMEGIYTLADNSEMQLAFIATMAQEESHIKSESMNRSYRMRFGRGIFLTPTLLGYDHDEEGDLIINEDEAKTVQLIFYMFLSGSTLSEIAERLMQLHRHTKVKKLSGEINWNWSGSTVRAILQNERYCGDVLAQKTFTPNYLNHKSVKNVYDLPQYYEEDHHEAIISREHFIAAQRMLEQTKYGFRNALPELKVIDKGVLKGFVQMNPCWMGFGEEDYLAACHSVLEDEDYLNPAIQIRRRKGSFDFRKYQVTRSQFVPYTNKISVNISYRQMRFSNLAIEEFPREQYVEILFHPLLEILVVRKGKRTDRHCIRWSVFQQEKYRAKKINTSSFTPVLYDLCGWNPQYRYTLTGYVKEKQGEKILIFYADEPEIRMVAEDRQVVAYPKEWKDNFGDYYLDHVAKTESVFLQDAEWNLYEAGVVSFKPDFRVPNMDEITEKLEPLIVELQEEAMLHVGE